MEPSELDRTIAGLDDLLVQAMNEHTLPGLAVGVIHDGRLVYTKGLGFADIQKRIPVSADTEFRIGSISKTFTAIGILQLYEQGKIQLDDPVNNYLKAYQIIPPYPGIAPVTFRHLLTHTSGIGELRRLTDAILPTGGLAEKPTDHPISLNEYYRGGLKAEVAPGQKWAYANHAYATLGQLVEDISGQPFDAYMLEQVFRPLGMEHSNYKRTGEICRKLAQGYEFKKGRFLPIEYQRVIVEPAGSIFSTVDDMACYVAALMNGGSNATGRVLQPGTLDLMMTNQLAESAGRTGMGLAFILTRYDGHPVVWHNGGWPGFTSAMYIAPADKLGVLVFTNASNPAPDLIASQVLHHLLGLPDPAETVGKKAILETPHLWSDLAGHYSPKPGFLTNLRFWLAYGGEAQVLVQGNHLVLRSLAGRMAKGLPLYRADPSNPLVFQVAMGKMVSGVEFRCNARGEVDRMTLGLNVLYKRPPIRSLRYRLYALSGLLTSLAALGVLRRLNHRVDRSQKRTGCGCC